MPRYEVIVTEELVHRLIVDAPTPDDAERVATSAVIDDDMEYFMHVADRTATVHGFAKDHEATDETFDPSTDYED